MHTHNPIRHALMMPSFKWVVYLLEAMNTLGCAYYGNYLLFLLRDDYGFGDLQLLTIGAAHGLVYVMASLFAGKFGQRRGYFASLRVGFGGMALSMMVAFAWSVLPGQLFAFGLWTVAMCFTWPMLEALASEHEPPATLPHRIGLYNVMWSLPSALAFFFGGLVFESLGRASLYWLPAVFFVANFVITFPLQRWHDTWLAGPGSQPFAAEELVAEAEPFGRAAYFQKLAWLANPFAYVAVNTFTAMIPGIAHNAGLSVAQAGMVLSIWFLVRAAVFAGLWAWHGWHYRFRWFVGSFVVLLGSFLTLMFAREVWVLIVAQVGFGFATGLLYYSSLFYSMDGSETKGEHGGVHEALIGAGICGGPAIGALSLMAAPGVAAAPAIAVGALLVAGLGLVVGVRVRARR